MSVPNPAALRLLQAGISGAELARRLGVSRQAVSFQLGGHTAATSSELLEAIAELGDADLALEVRDLIDTARAERSR